MNHCKYMLPCGMCDKYDIECKLLELPTNNDENNDEPMHEEVDDEKTGCEHNWYLRSNKFDEYEMCFVKTYECLNCGATNKEIQRAVVFSKDKEDKCEHDWQYDGASIESPVCEYYHCTKCGETKNIEVEAI